MRNYHVLGESPKRSRRKSRNFSSQLVILWLIAVLGINFFLFFNKKGIDYRQRVDEIIKLKNEIIALQQEKGILFKKAVFLKSDTGLEKLAREKIGLVKPDELAFVIISKNEKVSCNAGNLQPAKKVKRSFKNWFKKVFRWR